jgi:hypothetical protein
MEIWKTLDSQFATLAPTIAVKQRQASVNAFRSLAPALRSHRQKLEERGTLNAKGMQEELRAFAAKDVIRVYTRERRDIAATEQQMTDRRKSLATPDIDKTDVVGALIRQEARSYLRGLDDTKRAATLATTSDPIVASAVLEAPACLSGISDAEKGKLAQTIIATMQPKEVARLELEETALDVARLAKDAATKEIRELLGFGGDHDFERWLGTVVPDDSSPPVPPKVTI